MDFNFFNKAVASVSVCIMGMFSMHVTNNNVGIGWAILGIAFIWSND